MNEDSSSDEDEDPDNMGVPGKFFIVKFYFYICVLLL